MGTEQDVTQIEVSLEDAKKKVDLMTALVKLQNNQYFKQVFLDEYLDKYIVRLVKLKASPGMQSPENQMKVMMELDGVGQMDQYMRYIMQEGRMAEKSIQDYEEELDAIRLEEV